MPNCVYSCAWKDIRNPPLHISPGGLSNRTVHAVAGEMSLRSKLACRIIDTHGMHELMMNVGILSPVCDVQMIGQSYNSSP